MLDIKKCDPEDKESVEPLPPIQNLSPNVGTQKMTTSYSFRSDEDSVEELPAAIKGTDDYQRKNVQLKIKNQISEMTDGTHSQDEELQSPDRKEIIKLNTDSMMPKINLKKDLSKKKSGLAANQKRNMLKQRTTSGINFYLQTVKFEQDVDKSDMGKLNLTLNDEREN